MRVENDPEFSALHAAYAAAPDDDLPKLVLADGLEERAEADRAELLRVEVVLKSAPACAGSQCGPCETCRLKTRAEELRAGIRNAEWAEVLARFKPTAGLTFSAMRTALIGLQKTPAVESMMAGLRGLRPEALANLQCESVEPKPAPIAKQLRWFPNSLRGSKVKRSRTAVRKWPA